MAGRILNFITLKNGRLVQLDDVLAENAKPIPPGPTPPVPVPPGPTPPGPTPPGPTPPGPTPEPQVTVSLSLQGTVLTMTATGDTEYVDGYIIDIFVEDTLKKSYVTTENTFDLGIAAGELDDGIYTVKARAYSDDGKEFEESAGVTWSNNITIIIGTNVNGTTMPLAAGGKILKF